MKRLTIIIFLLIITSASLSAKLTHEEIQLFDGPYIIIENDTTVKVRYSSFQDREHPVEYFAYGKGQIAVNGFNFDKIKIYNVFTSHDTPEYKTDNASKIFVFSDIHGEYEYLIELLLNNKIIDSNLNWSFGDGHLVIDGDIPDRGDKVTEILWLVYKLEQQAELAGGKVHYLLGNHEMMVLQSDLRYIHERYKKVAELLAPDSLLSTLYSNNTVLGQWLRSKNICEVINGILFVHGGLSPKMMHKNYSLEYINQTMRDNIDTPRDSIKADTSLYNLFGSFGPIWYRGYHYDMEKYKQLTMPQVDSLLEFYKVSNIIVGHTVKDSTAVLYDGKIFGVNQDYEIRDEIEGLFIENGMFHACDINGVRRQIHDSK